MKKWQIVLATLVALGAGLYWFLAVPAQATPAGVESAARFVPGSYPVVEEDFESIDDSRPLQANNDFAGAASRPLKGTVWRPQGLQRPGPLLVYSHGFMSFRQEGQYLDRFLASHGYTVVAVDFPLTTTFAPGGPMIGDVVNQPGDVSFLIDLMLKRNADPADVLHGTIDAEKIAVAGVSLGGLTTTLVAFHRELRDPRIAAAISIAGPGSMFTADFFAGSTLPFLMIYGDADAIVPYAENAAVAKLHPGTELVTLKGASHAAFAAPAATLMRFMANPDLIGCKAVMSRIEDGMRRPTELIPGLSSPEYGIDPHRVSQPCATALAPQAMQAARQHMFTTLAAHAFLESIFADEPAEREAAGHYLQVTLPAENPQEIAFSQPGVVGT